MFTGVPPNSPPSAGYTAGTPVRVIDVRSRVFPSLATGSSPALTQPTPPRSQPTDSGLVSIVQNHDGSELSILLLVVQPGNIYDLVARETDDLLLLRCFCRLRDRLSRILRRIWYTRLFGTLCRTFFLSFLLLLFFFQHYFTIRFFYFRFFYSILFFILWYIRCLMESRL